MTRSCYFHPVPLVTARGKTACPQCGTSYPFLPAVEPFCSAPAATPRRVLSSPSAGAFYTPSAPLAGRADAAPGGSHPQQAGRGNRTQETEMTKPNDGGPAYPQPDLSGYGMGPVEIDGRYQMQGMSLRDYFAGQALAGILTNENLPWSKDVADIPDEAIGRACYDLADAMIKAREVRDDQA